MLGRRPVGDPTESVQGNDDGSKGNKNAQEGPSMSADIMQV